MKKLFYEVDSAAIKALNDVSPRERQYLMKAIKES